MVTETVEIEHYGHFVHVMRKLGVEIFHFRKNVTLRHFDNGFELDVPRDMFPKQASAEQLQYVYEEVLELLRLHPKRVNYRLNEYGGR